ncbi:MAG: hypothetical protein AB2815_05680, partial [Candidatus Sedimenticola endophacoides]
VLEPLFLCGAGWSDMQERCVQIAFRPSLTAFASLSMAVSGGLGCPKIFHEVATLLRFERLFLPEVGEVVQY